MACVTGMTCNNSGSCSNGRCPTVEDWDDAWNHCKEVRHNRRGCMVTTLANATSTTVSREMLDSAGVRDDRSVLGDVSAFASSGLGNLIPVVGNYLNPLGDLFGGLTNPKGINAGGGIGSVITGSKIPTMYLVGGGIAILLLIYLATKHK